MKATAQEIESFRDFALRLLEQGGPELTMDDLYEQWRVERFGDLQAAADLEAIRESLRDLEAGETGIPYEVFDREMKFSSAE